MPSPAWHERVLADLSGSLQRLAFLPLSWRYRIVSLALGRQSRYFRTHGLRIVHIDPGRVAILARDRRHLRNRAGALHAMAASLAGEYAAALVVAQHLRRGAGVRVKGVRADFRRPIRGQVHAHARIAPEQIAALAATAEGRVRIPMQVVDETGKAPVRGQVEVVWFGANGAGDTS